MRTLRSRPFLLAGLSTAALCLVAAGGCKWTDFDDLKGDAWATAATKSDTNSAANWGVAIARLGQGDTGGTLAVLGASQPIYSDLTIGPDGDVNTTTERELDTDFAIGNLAIEPLLLSRPDADEAALVTGLDATHVLAIRAIGGQLTPFPVSGPAQPSGATYMVSPPRPGVDPGPQTQILVAQDDSVFGAFFDPMKAPNPQTKCALRDEAAAMIKIRALGAYRPAGAASDDVLVLTDAGKLMAYPGTVFNGCGAGMQPPKPGFVRDIMFAGVQTGSQIHVFADASASYAVVQAHSDAGKGRLGLYRIDADSIDEIGAALDLDRLKTAALFQPAGDTRRFVIAGLPTAIVEGVNAGQVQVREINTATGIAMTPAATLFDSRPENAQTFGRGVAALPYNGKSIIAVAADNEVFLYFRTTLYGETRQGR
jgi:hypothetical protein